MSSPKMPRLLALSASAGSGKTFALVARYIALLFTGARPSEILAITFTNKAAGEMRERVTSALASLPEAMIPAIAEASGLSEAGLQARRPEVLRRFLESDLKVMTIDSFIHQVLRKFCWYAGLDADFEIASTPKERFFEAFLESLDDKTYAGMVDFARFEAQKSGSIVDFFELLYEKEKELPPLPQEADPYDEREVMKWAHKIRDHFLAAKVSDRARKALDKNSAREVAAASWFSKESLDYWDFKKGYTPEVDGWFKALKRAVADYYRRKERYYLARMHRLFGRYLEVRNGHIRQTGQLHFKDIEHFTYDLLRRPEFTDFLYFRLDARISHLLFDEFQDTSVTQYRLFEPIIAEIASAQTGRSFFYVGDTKQSIYRFRGGQKALFDHVARRFDIPVEHLRVNYRSREAIVGFVNRTFPYVQPPQEAVREGGLVEVREGDPLEEGLKVVESLLGAGIAPEAIAILVHDNKEILEVGDAIKARFGLEIATHKRARVASQPTAAAIIEAMRLLYARSRGRSGDLHRLNFLALTGRDYDPAFAVDIPLERPTKMVRRLMETYGLADEASMRLLEFTIPLHDLTEFVVEVARYDEELPPREVKGIQVLTIHKSKGLEFEHVIVLDRFGKGAGDRATVLFEYEDIALRRIWMKFKNREAVDGEYAAAKGKEERLKAEDAMNRTYVAFTRAGSALFVVKKEKQSAFEGLELPVGRIGSLPPAGPTSPPAPKPAPLRVELRDYGRQAVTVQPERYEANDFAAIYLGQGVHYLFETDDFDAFLNRYGRLCDPLQARALYEAGRDLPAYRALTEGKVTHELPYVYNREMGIVDLFVDRGESGVIIDYKTVTPHDIEPYRRQLHRYKDALSALVPGKRIETYLYFLDRLELVRVG
ncbi:RecB-like helicase [Hydrogenimonas sp. SS33]|uniref:RecB-like helicase n=1 Tax=Hydrogenimonas leucolamina TaxID=2954236 RepID=UPI00336C2AA8